uniref:Ribonuclease H-like domain-containing protein n=1 Tax=Tanacetum cinerariifolium TaxID=118510 RepID=A0A6L2MXS3_TANCI|nr:ribonuclease H-like domain-containing protein [Tanacetum cinerariifolium]
MQTQESKIDMGKAIHADLVITKSSGTESKVQDDNSRSGNDTDADDTDIRPIYDEEPMAEVQLTVECNILAIGQQHIEQPKIINEEYFNGENQVVSKSSVVTTVDASDKRQQQPDSTSSTSILASIVTADGIIDLNLKAQNLKIQTDNGTEFKNKKLRAFYAKIGIVHQTSIAQTPQQNGVVECRYRTLVKAARTMLIFSKAPEFLWAKAIATACFTHNRSIVHTWKMKTKADIGIFIGYSESSRGFQYYATSSQEVSDNSAANTLDNKDTSSSSSTIIEEDKAP